jgi:LPS export ABC transporter permease LptG/LPS export ABC transporter permease LptF
MRILDRYIFREILIPTLIGLVALTFVLFSRELGRLLEIIIRQAATMSELAEISVAILPKVLTFTLPMAVLVGILTGFGRMSSDNEAIALRAVGISMRRVSRPVLVLAVAAWLVNAVLTVWIAPGTASRLSAVEKKILLKQVVGLEVQPRVFNESLPNFDLYVRERRDLEWRGIMLSDKTDPNNPQVTFAQSGVLVQDEANHAFQLTLFNGNRHKVSPAAPRNYDFFGFDKTTIPIPMPAAAKPPERPAAEDTPTRALWQRIRNGGATYDERVEFHSRIALPFACLALALVGLPLGVSTTRGSKSMGLVLSLLLMLVYYLLLVGGTRMAGAANFSPVLGAWIPNIGFVALGIFLLVRSDRAYENRGLAWFRRGLDWGANRIASVQLTRQNMNRWAYSLWHRPKFFRLLDIYVLRGFWFFFMLVLVVFVSLFVIITLFELLPDIIQHNVPVVVVAIYFLYFLPQILYWVVPLTVLLAILINLGALTKTNEILAVKAGAISLYRLSIPLLFMGLLLSAGVYLMQEFVLPYSNQRQDEYHDVIKGRAPQTYRDPQRKWMVGSHDDRLYHYNFFDSFRNVFGGIEIFQFERNTFDLRQWTFAARGTWDNGAWTLEDGWTRRLAPDQSVTYESFHTLQLTDMESPEYFKKEVRTAAQLSYSELKAYVRDLQQSGFDVTSLTLDLYRKLSFPLVSSIMAIIGIPFSFKTGKKGAFYGIGFCVVIGIIYWTTFELFERLGGINRLSPFIAAWFPNLIFGLSGMWMMLRVKT